MTDSEKAREALTGIQEVSHTLRRIDKSDTLLRQSLLLKKKALMREYRLALDIDFCIPEENYHSSPHVGCIMR